MPDASPAFALPPLHLAGRQFDSRLLMGTGRFAHLELAQQAVAAAGAQILTVAIRRVEGAAMSELLQRLPPEQFCWLPNSAGCYNAAEAVRVLRLARELLDGHSLVKLEVLGDEHSLYPNMRETFIAAETLIKEGFEVLAYCADDPIAALELEQLGCAAVMPLGSLIGSGMGLVNPLHLSLIRQRLRGPMIVDAGIGTASDAALAMELGADAVLVNSAIAYAENPVAMAYAMRQAVTAGYWSRHAGRMPKRSYQAQNSSPTSGVVGSAQ